MIFPPGTDIHRALDLREPAGSLLSWRINIVGEVPGRTSLDAYRFCDSWRDHHMGRDH